MMGASVVEDLERRSTGENHCNWWIHLRIHLEHEVRLMEQIDEGASRCCWLCERGIVSFLGANLTEWVTDRELAPPSQVCWMSKDSDAWNGDP